MPAQGTRAPPQSQRRSKRVYAQSTICVPSHFERKGVVIAREVRKIQHFALLHGFHRRARGDPAEQWNLSRRSGAPLLLNVFGRQFQRPALVKPALQVALGLEHRDMFVDRG